MSVQGLPSQSALSAEGMMIKQGKRIGGVGEHSVRDAPVFMSMDKFFKAMQQQMEKIEIANCAPGKIFSPPAVAVLNADKKMPSIFGKSK